MKVTGEIRKDGIGKNYLINHNGVDYTAIKNGTLFCCNGVTNTLKAVKEMIKSGEIGAQVNVSPEKKEVVFDPALGKGLWMCVHPCALLVLTVGDRALDEDMRKQFILTLDNYGWLTEKGSPDYKRAMKDYKLHKEGVLT